MAKKEECEQLYTYMHIINIKAVEMFWSGRIFYKPKSIIILLKYYWSVLDVAMTMVDNIMRTSIVLQ